MNESQLLLEDGSIRSAEVYRELMEIHDRQRSEWRENISNYKAAREQLRNAYFDDLEKLLGKKKYSIYRKLHDRRVRNDAIFEDKVLRNGEDIHLIRQRREEKIKKTLRLIRKAGIDIKSIEALRRKYIRKLKKLYAASPDNSKRGKRGDLKNLSDKDTHQIVLSRPFVWGESDSEAFSTNVEPDYMISTDPASGFIGHESRVRMVNPSGDHGFVNSLTLLYGVCTLTGNANVLHLTVDFEVDRSDIFGSSYDECWTEVCLIYPGINHHFGIRKLPSGQPQTHIEYLHNVIYTMGDCDGLHEERWKENTNAQTVTAEFSGSFKEGDYLAVWFGMEMMNRIGEADSSRVQSYFWHEYRVRYMLLSF